VDGDIFGSPLLKLDGEESEKERRRLEEEVSEYQISTCGWSQLEEDAKQTTHNNYYRIVR